jgi:predicted GH43/DUF377 family glycosyl hydrolase
MNKDSAKSDLGFKKVFSEQGRYVNDHCFIAEGDTLHLFYIDGEVGKGCYDLGNEVIIGHASSHNLTDWTKHEPAVVYDTSLSHEERGVFAPYVIMKDGTYHMLYSSHNMEKAQFICLAFSRDLFNWERYEGNPAIVPKGDEFLWDIDIPCSCRDPHVYMEDGRYYTYWVGDMADDPEKSCIALSVSDDLINFEQMGPVMVKRHSYGEAYVMKTESPCVVKRHGKYYLFFRHGDGTKYCISDDLYDFNDCEVHLLGPSHASEIFEFRGRWYISSCSREPGDIWHKTDRTKGLYLAELDFDGVIPGIVGL